MVLKKEKHCFLTDCLEGKKRTYFCASFTNHATQAFIFSTFYFFIKLLMPKLCIKINK